MQVLRALSIAAVVSTANGAFACEIHSTTNKAPTEAQIISLLNEPVLLNRDDPTQRFRLQLAEASIVASANEPVLLNREDFSQGERLQLAEETFTPTWEHLDLLPGPVSLAHVDLQFLRVVVDDEGIPLMDVAHTGSTSTSASFTLLEADLAMDGYEDR